MLSFSKLCPSTENFKTFCNFDFDFDFLLFQQISGNRVRVLVLRLYGVRLQLRDKVRKLKHV